MKLTVFGYTFSIEKHPIHKIQKISGGMVAGGCKITQRDDYILLTDENGKILPHQVSILVSSDLDRPATATVEFLISGVHTE